MCGIFGIKSSKSLDENINLVKHNCEIIYHRGPDSSNIWYDKNSGFVFGHTRLAIIELDVSGNQPMVSNSKRYVLAFNGEIYNFRELKQKLNDNNNYILWNGNSDTEVLLNLFEIYGIEKTLSLVNGMFAFVLWDNLKQNIYMARDRLGEKPLYYSINNKSVIFGSELKTFYNVKDLDLSISPSSINNYFKYGYIKSPNTIYNNIYQLEPGHYLKVKTKENNNYKIKKYWELNKEQDRYEDIKNLNSKLYLKLNQAVKSRMFADVSSGCFLSGGYDSSIISYFMQKNSINKIETFTIGQHNEKDESKYARNISKFLGTNHNEYFIEDLNLIDDIEKITQSLDQPFGDSSIIPTFLVSKFASQKVKVCLSGDGGDEIFGGYTRYNYVKLFNLLSKFTPKIIKFFLSSIPNINLLKFNRAIELINSNSEFEINEKMKIAWKDSNQLLSEDIYNQVTFNKKINALPKETDLLLEDLTSYLPDDILTKVDRASMLNSLEVRSPLLDHELVEFMNKIPNKYKYSIKNNKILFKNLAHDYIPRELLDRKKAGFSISIKNLLRTDLKEWSHELLSSNNLSKHNFFKKNHVFNLLNDHKLEKKDNSYQIWYLLMFQSWYLNYKND